MDMAPGLAARDDKRSSYRPHWNFGALVTASSSGFYRCLLGGHLQGWRKHGMEPSKMVKLIQFWKNLLDLSEIHPMVASIPRKLLV